MNLALHPESGGITAHHTPRGPRRSTRLNYGTTSAAEIFQKEVAEALEGIDGCFNISDNIMVFGSSQKEHEKYLGEVSQRCQERDLRLGFSFFQDSGFSSRKNFSSTYQRSVIIGLYSPKKV